MDRPETFSALNGLRFVAALAVVISHFAPKVVGYDRLLPAIKNLVNEGPTAVGFFFILSGFVLAHRYLYNGTSIDRLSAFYWSRFTRLYPAYMLAYVLFVPLAIVKYLNSVAGHKTFFLAAALSGLMLQAWTMLAQAWNGPSWSLSVEIFMYIVFPLVGFRLLRLSSKKMLVLMAILWLIPTLSAVAYTVGLIPASIWVAYMQNNPLLWIPLFLMGICATKALPAWQKLSERGANAISTIACVVLVAVVCIWPKSWSEIFITGGSAPLLVAIVIFFSRLSGWITKIMGGGTLNRLGQASYVVYILQSPAWHYWQAITNHIRHVPLQALFVESWQFLLFIPFLVLLALFVQRFFETPARVWLGTLHKSIALWGDIRGLPEASKL